MNRAKNYLLRAGLLLSICAVVCACDSPYFPQLEQNLNRPQASFAYLEYFGSPPIVADAQVEALVGYLPLASDHDHVAPFPLFMSTSSNHLHHLSQRLIEFDREMASVMGLINPFPAGTKIQSIRRNQDQLFLDLSYHAGRQSNPLLRRAMVLSIVHSLTQFRGVREVVLSIDGQILAASSRLPDRHEVIGPSQPKLLGILNAAVEGSSTPVLTLYFDRPVLVQALALRDESGAPVRGKISTSFYGMALEMRLQPNTHWAEGERMRVQWKAVDALGTRGEGDSVLFLRLKD